MNRLFKYGLVSLLAVLPVFLLAACLGKEAAPPTPKPGTTASIRSAEQEKYHKINYISKVQEIRSDLGNSQHVITIHHNSNETSHYMKREVTVKFRTALADQELASILRVINGKTRSHHNSTYIFKSSRMSTDELIAYFSKRNDVQFAEPNYLLLPNAIPNDSLYPRYQWNMPAINMEQAWDISKGSDAVTIAVIDTGLDLHHLEFTDKVVDGYNVLNPGALPQDDNGHGTHVAGIIAARTNNGRGVAGVTWNNKLMPIKGIGGNGSGSSFDIAKGIIWATDHGARVINMSVGNYQSSSVLHDAIKYAFSKDVVMVAASGNDHSSQPSYPASYPEVISVAAIDQNGNQAPFSNFGSSVDLAAPGVDIPSTYLPGEYAALSGTSMACPHVSGLAGLIRSLNPSLSNRQVMKIMRATARDAGPAGWDHDYGYGIMDVPQALRLAISSTPPVAASKSPAQPLPLLPPTEPASGLLERLGRLFTP
ncbi:type VII secretion-associated serine protease mycosin [Aneurinibacillus soli]|uniref:Thermophilic serine proteinase n=1 Tax=Aneurinibacillus soli TaxID=1500254 RepID=A0A0U5B9A8_9BACL|nr:S8 family peptidase [Aneurinibacillus soli]PYE63742.1 type VII secretion-associated serine protease mycosin [Aneurinibacillus soli]BAU27325.1 Thermophilic serine proteinase precursor [Aneurinibacillus soli]